MVAFAALTFTWMIVVFATSKEITLASVVENFGVLLALSMTCSSYPKLVSVAKLWFKVDEKCGLLTDLVINKSEVLTKGQP